MVDDAARVALVRFMLASFGHAHFQCTGISMLPALWPGDVVSVSQRNLEDLRPGDIVAFVRADKLVAHRVVRLLSEKSVLITRGDHCYTEDSPVHSDDLLGRVDGIKRGSMQLTPRADPAATSRVAASVLRASGVATRVVLGLYQLSRAGWVCLRS